MVRVTIIGPTRLMPLARRVSAAQTWFRAGRAARAGHQAGARVGHLARLQAGLGDGLLQRQEGVGRRVAHEAQGAAVDRRFQVERRPAADLRAQAALGVLGVEAQPERALRRLSSTSARLLPRLETMPCPVTTTRRSMIRSSRWR
jgi:GAF domain-containing protein